MRTVLKWIVRCVLIIGLAAVAVGIWKREEISRLMAVNSLFEADRIVSNFSNMDQAFLNRPVDRGDGPVSALPEGSDMPMPSGYDQWVIDRAVTSMLVLQAGQLVHEAYYLDTTAADRRISWSVAKSYLSALFGILLDEGAIASLDDPVTKYVPDLTGTAYEGASVRNVLNMASGVVFDEDYLDYDSDINKMGRTIALGGKLDDFTAALSETFAEPGETWQYVSIDTHVIGMVIRGATGRDVASLLSEKVIAPLGYEQSPYYLTDGDGVAFVLGGLNLTTRDYARFGQMILQDGMWNGVQVVPSAWIADSTAPTAPTQDGEIQYGYQWWIPADARPGEVLARGIYGQYIYIDRDTDLVIVSTAADRSFREAGAFDEVLAMFRAISDQTVGG